MHLKFKHLVLLITGIFFLSNDNKGQTNSDYRAIGDAKIAFDFFSSQNFRLALEEYKLLYKIDSSNIFVNHHLAICYLNTNINKKKAIPLLEFVTSQNGFNPQAWYDLGRAYRYDLKLDKAIEAFRKFETEKEGNEENFISAKRQIEMCENAKKLIKSPLDIKIENMGEIINSEYPDFNPYINANDTELYFSSKRMGNLGSFMDFDGYNTTDIYYSEYKYNKWNKARRFTPLVNTPYIEECTGLSADGQILFVFVANEYAVNDVFYTEKNGRSYTRAESLGQYVNKVESSEFSASVSPDMNYLFFSSDREGGFGGKDIYFSKRLPSGQWGPAKNAGVLVNTEYDEDFPYLAPDGTSFYFCSLGHNSMGGFDIFRSEWSEKDNKWDKPQNIGYPLNNTSDNMCISFTESGRYAYVSMFREDSYGELDIYRVTFNRIQAQYSIIKYVILGSDSVKITDYDSIKVEVTEKDSGKFIGHYKPNKANQEYSIILSPGSYILEINSNDYLPFKEEINIPDRYIKSEILHKSIILKKQ